MFFVQEEIDKQTGQNSGAAQCTELVCCLLCTSFNDDQEHFGSVSKWALVICRTAGGDAGQQPG